VLAESAVDPAIPTGAYAGVCLYMYMHICVSSWDMCRHYAESTRVIVDLVLTYFAQKILTYFLCLFFCRMDIWRAPSSVPN